MAGGPEVFLSYGHQSECSTPAPRPGHRSPGGEYRWLEASALPLVPNLVLPAGPGAVVVQTDFNAWPEAAARVERDGTVAPYPLDQAPGSLRGALAAHPDGSLLILAEGDGRSQLWRFRTGLGTPTQVVPLMGTYSPPLDMAPETVLCPTGALALLLHEASRGQALLVLDAKLQLRWRWRTMGQRHGLRVALPPPLTRRTPALA